MMSKSHIRAIGRSPSWLGLLAVLLTVLAGIWFVGFVTNIGDRIERERVLALARTVAASVAATEVTALHGDRRDIDTAAFDALRERLRRARTANPDFRFVYLMRPSTQVPDQMQFLVDAEPSDSPDYSAPGDLYSGFSEDLWRVWRSAEALVQPAYRDNWGRWVTTVAPVRGEDGALVAVLGMDMRADAWHATLARYRNFALAIIVLVLLLELMFLLGLQRQRRAARRLGSLNSRLARQLDELRLAQAGLGLADMVVRHTGEAMVLLDARLRVIRANPAFTRTTGYTLEEVSGKPLGLFDRDDVDLLRRIQQQLDETAHWNGTLWAARADGEPLPLEGSVDVVRDAQGQIMHYVVVFRDVTMQKRLEDRLRELSVTDALTGLPNRRNFDETMEREWHRSMRQREPISLVMIDIDHFKAFNDVYGHPAGDRALRQVATALLAAVEHEGAMVARYGGEEFAVILPRCDVRCAAAMAETLRQRVAALRIVHRGNRSCGLITISVGASTRTAPDGIDLDDLLLSADQALYRAKARGRNGVAAA